MKMNYIRKEANLTSLLNEIETFEEGMVKFIDKHPNYSYNLKLELDEIEREWIVNVNIEKDEPENITIT